ncbi:MAG TPA: rod shape-determining protein MreC [Rhizomicrobium sp.]
MANGTWRIARGRSSAQLPTALAGALAVLLLVAGRAHFVPFERARAAITDHTGPVLQAINAPVFAVTRWTSGMRHFFDIYSENLQLREDNARLLQWQSAAQTFQEQVRRYQVLLKAVPDPSYATATAKVIARSSQPFLETIVLNAGQQNGVKPGQAVIDARGLLGRIYIAGKRTAWVILLNDLNSRIPVAVRAARVEGILAGTNAAEPNLEALPQNVKLKAGQEVVTSGDGGLMPPGLPVGLLEQEGGAWKVALFADPSGADEVRVLGFRSPLEPMPKPTERDLPANVAGLPPPQPEPEQTATTATQIPNQTVATASAGTAQANPAVPRATPKPTVVVHHLKRATESPATIETRPRAEEPPPEQANPPDDDQTNQ